MSGTADQFVADGRGVGGFRDLGVDAGEGQVEGQPFADAGADLELHAGHLDLALLDAEEQVIRIGRQHVLLHDLVGRERAEQPHVRTQVAAVVLDAGLDLVAGGRLERHAVEGRAAHGLERRRRLDVGREAVLEHVVGADAVGEFLVVLRSRRSPGLRSTQSLRRIQRQDEVPELDLVLEVDADLLAGLVDEREDRLPAG